MATTEESRDTNTLIMFSPFKYEYGPYSDRCIIRVKSSECLLTAIWTLLYLAGNCIAWQWHLWSKTSPSISCFIDFPTEYFERYRTEPVWNGYRRNHKGGIPPQKTRKTCIVREVHRNVIVWLYCHDDRTKIIMCLVIVCFRNCALWWKNKLKFWMKPKWNVGLLPPMNPLRHLIGKR